MNSPNLKKERKKKLDQRMMKWQDDNEIRVFAEFAGVCPYPICLGSVTKKRPPEPDISCNLSDGSAIAFELVECIDNSIAQSTYDSLRLNKALVDELDKLPQERRERFRASFGNALIYIAFVGGLSLNKRKGSIPALFDYLLTLGGTGERKFDLRSHQDLGGVVRSIAISCGYPTGPALKVEAITSFADPCRERIQKKFKKEYKAESPVELLAYYELQPELPETHWLPSVEEFMKKNLKSSVFQRVWIYSVTKNRIILAYPRCLRLGQGSSKGE